VTVGNVLSGVAVAAALLVAFPLEPPKDHDLRVCPWGVVRLAGFVVVQLVSSNVEMTREVLRPTTAANPGVLAHHLQAPSEVVVTLLTSIISLSPGTMTVDVDAEASTIYVHFLFLDDLDRARAQLDRLERLVRGAVEPRSTPATRAAAEEAS
jgi:multicomponent Na+:H+ antiporter subunit E